jgi:ferrous-iron efflux pump FieF
MVYHWAMLEGPSAPKNHQPEKALLASQITVGMVIVLVFAKTIAYIYSGSAAVLSTLIDSVSDIGLSMMTFLSIRWSLKPADEDHRFGHGKIEGVAALLQAAFLVGAGSFLFLEAAGRFLSPSHMTHHVFTMMLMGFSTLVSWVMTLVQRHNLKKSGSLALEADYAHYSSDILINGSAFVVILLDYLEIIPVWFDPLAALIVAGLLARAAYGIALRSFDMLMDRDLGPDVRKKIMGVITAHPEVLSAHDLRTSQSGMKIFISFDIDVDPNILLWSAHEIGQAVERDLLKEFPNAEIMIHIDPSGAPEDARHTLADEVSK